MFSFLIEIEIKMDRRHRVVVLFTHENDIGWCEHEISAPEMGQHKIESDASCESTRDIDEPPPIVNQVYLGSTQT